MNEKIKIVTAKELYEQAENINTDKYISIFISVKRKDKFITTWTEGLEVEDKSNSVLTKSIIDTINKVKNKKHWIDGKIETITIRDYNSKILYKKENPIEFNYLLK